MVTADRHLWLRQDPFGGLDCQCPAGDGGTRPLYGRARFTGSPASGFNPQSEVRYDELFEQLRTTPLLILDDLGAQSRTPWAQEKLFQLLNHRYNAHLATVVTTNQRLEDLGPARAAVFWMSAWSIISPSLPLTFAQVGNPARAI